MELQLAKLLRALGLCTFASFLTLGCDDTGPQTPVASLENLIPAAIPLGVVFTTKYPALDGSGNPAPYSIRLTSENGGQLYRSEQDGDSEASEERFWPFIAHDQAKAFRSWSLIDLADGKKQWAYLAKPLYIMTSGNETSGESSNDLPSGWSEAIFEPAAGFILPSQIAVQSNTRASGSVLVDHIGMTLYFYPGDVISAERQCTETCGREWRPLQAAALANAVGSFRPVDRQDGIRQWEYNGNALFTSTHDVAPQDVNGINDQSQGWRVAMIEKYFQPEEVEIGNVFPFGAILTTSSGMPIYTRNRMEGNLQASTNYRGMFRQIYETGKAIGTGGCDAACLLSWKPVKAPVDASASGFWEVATRSNGQRQWVYKGYSLYTYENDKPGLVTGNNYYDPDEGDQGRYKASALPAAIRSRRTGAYYWHVAEADL